MSQKSPPIRAGNDKEALLANVALLYYGDGLTQGEIARRMKVSRATIVNLLREARERGIVDIRVHGRYIANTTLARDLRARYGLSDVYVSRAGEEGRASRADELAQLARVAGEALLDVLEPGDRLGIAWSETIHRMALEIPRQAVPGVEVCQMVGSMVSSRISAAETCAIEIANALSARCFTLHAPGVVASRELAQIFLAEPTIRAQLERLDLLDLAVTSIGTLSPDTHLVAAGIATPDELSAALAAGARGIVCCRYIDAEGEACRVAPDDRLIGIDIPTLRRARKRMLVVCGADRAHAVRAAIRGGLVSHLCLDYALAERLLAD